LSIIKGIATWVLVLGCALSAGPFYESRDWLNLLYYEKTGPNAYHSSVDDDRFFITQSGKTDPKAEYEASLKKVEAQDEAFRRAFPLRYKRISQHAKLDYVPLVFPDESIESLTLAFPNRYMANPSSMFGHLFIVMKSKRGFLDSNLIHYIADTSSADSGFYLYNGLNGKFSGRYLKEPYYIKIKAYNYVEDRTVLYYDLALPKSKVEDLQLHSIELENATFDYYFIDENCAFFIGKLLNVITDIDVMGHDAVTLPSDLVNTLRKEGLFKNEYFRQPSTQVFNQNYYQLNRAQKTQVARLSTELVSDGYEDVDVLETFLHTSEYLINTRPNDSQTVRHNRVLAYQALRDLGRPAVRPALISSETISPVHSKGYRAGYGSTGRMFFSYHPIFYSTYGHFDDFETKLLDVISPRVILSDGKDPQLDFTFVAIENITQYNRILKNHSWKLSSFFSYQDRVSMHHSFQIGRSFAFQNRALLTLFAGGNFSNYNPMSEAPIDRLSLRPSLSLGLGRYFPTHHFKLDTSYHYLFGEEYFTGKLSLNARRFFPELDYIYTKDFQEFRLSVSWVL